jgi:hypothetical protein
VPAIRGPFDRARGTVTLAAESIATILPGVVVDGLEALDVVPEVDVESGLRSTVWGAGVSTTSRRLAAIKRIVAQLFPENAYRGLFSYRVVSQSGERLNLQAERVSMEMPDLKRVRVRPGLPGCKAQHALGSLVLVGFVEGFDVAASFAVLAAIALLTAEILKVTR